jgi:hypothetical protein
VSIATATEDVLTRLLAAGVRAVDDARDLNPPCVYVVPPDANLRFDKGRAQLEWTAYLIVGNNGARPATRALSELLDKLAGVFPITTVRRQPLNVPGGGDPLPAYELAWISTITIGAVA